MAMSARPAAGSSSCTAATVPRFAVRSPLPVAARADGLSGLGRSDELLGCSPVGQAPNLAFGAGSAFTAAAATAVAAHVGRRRRRCAGHGLRARSDVARAAVARVGELPTAAKVMPAAILESQYGKETEQVIDALVEAMHVACISTLFYEEAKEKTSIGYFGARLEKEYNRNDKNGKPTTLISQAIMTALCRRLQEKFPDDLVLAEEDAELLSRDAKLATHVQRVLSKFGVAPDCTLEDVGKWAKHAGSYDAAGIADDELPERFWVIVPMDTLKEFQASKQYCFTVALIENGEPVVSGIACPALMYDHPTRTQRHKSGTSIFYAVKGHGAWSQLVLMDRKEGVYSGRFAMRGASLPCLAKEKIVRAKDTLFDMLGSQQLRLCMHSRQREDIMKDAEKIAKNLGSDYPKLEFCNNALKYCRLVRGDFDIWWHFPRGLYDKSSTERIVHHAAGALLATEAGAQVADLDGKPISWGRYLLDNRGVLVTDPTKVPLKGAVLAISEATKDSAEAYEVRCKKRKEVAQMLSYIFKRVGELAETEEEKEGAAAVMKRGSAMLGDDEKMNELAQDQLNRDAPILGEGPTGDGSFDNSDGYIPLSPIQT
eukprot:CAMPEP_0170608386 /NCGR_PEP_ID=MMETSP0224-20130122/21557_1 /TAXON_ID=285029 /ORGANISM="Togula jolla, Strain CCCM 725" /LENGTH=599 /DNA_ID=CAMNT_0010933609 /DNA_START=44 /DNA_END=1843 /DNA_ORIENTATION=-